jgi:hypothetical protein
MPKNITLKATKVSKATLTSGPMVFKWNTLPSAKPLIALEADFINCNSSPPWKPVAYEWRIAREYGGKARKP